MFPTPLAILIFLAPESPWWLVRKGKHEAAAKAVERLGRKSTTNSTETVAMMRRVIELEKTEKEPNHIELFKGTDLRRTLIVCGVYAAQNLTGNLIANQAVYFFEREWRFICCWILCVLTCVQRLVYRPTLHSLWALSLPPCSGFLSCFHGF